MNVHSGNTEIRYDLKRPCRDCPFRVGAAFHGGVAKALPEYFGHMEKGTFVHTCHKTDGRADSEEGKKFTGKIQHCGGLLLMMNNDASLLGIHQIRALEKGAWKPELMDRTQKVFKDMGQMTRHYIKLLKEKLKGEGNGTSEKSQTTEPTEGEIFR